MARSPTIVVTILQAASVGAPRHREHQRDAVRDELLRRDLLLGSTVAAAGGTVVTSGDETFAAIFSTPKNALSAALSAQRALQAIDRDELDDFPVCIALHTAPAPFKDDPSSDPAFGETARLLGAGRGGQVLLSEATIVHVRDVLPQGCSLRSLGRRQLKGRSNPEEVFQLVAHGLSDDMPPLTVLDSEIPERHLDPTRLPFVGRDAELYALHNALDQALAGNGQVALLVGEPGIGKTRTAERLTLAAAERGTWILWGNCFEWQGAPAYWPWTQVLRAWLREVDEQTLGTFSREQAALVSQIIPEIQERLHDLPVPPAMEPDARFFQLLAATGSLFRVAAAHQPLVVVLDDIHWADSPSLQLLRFLAQEIRDTRALLIATYRDTEVDREHPASPILADLVREPHCHRFLLQGLPKQQVARFIALATGTAQPQSLVNTVYGETEGNPFFVTEVVRVLVEDAEPGQAISAQRRTRVPETVREAVRWRVARLTPDCVFALTVASVIGRDFDVNLLARATGVPAPELLEALEEALRSQLLLPGEEPGTFRFTHALVQETLYQESSTASRAKLHLAVGEALEESADRQAPWAELARHFYAAIPFDMPAKAANYSEKAGQAAMEQFAWQTAATHFEHALATLPLTGKSDPTRTCDLLLSLGEAQNRFGSGAGDVPEARSSFLEAFELAQELGDGERMARAAVGYAGMNMVAVFGGPRQLELLEEAFVALDPVDSPLRVRVLARLAVDLWHRSSDNLDKVQELSDAAVSMAARLGDPTLVGYALWARHASGHRPDNLEERVIDSARLASLAEQTADPLIATWGYLLQVCDCIEVGDFFVAEQAMDWLRRFDERVRISYLAQRVAAFDAALSLLRGRYAEAESGIERARALWQSSAPRQHQFQPFLLLRDLGRLSQMTEEIRLPDHLHPWRRAAQAHRMALALEQGHIAEARADYETLVADDLGRVRLDRHWFVTAAMLAEATVAFEDVERAKTLITLMEPYSDRIAIDGSLVVAHGPIALCLGRLATVLDRWDDARAWLDQALAISQRLGLQPYEARALLGQAELLARRNGPGDLGASRNLADRAFETSSAIGMQGLIPRIAKLRDGPPTKTRDPFGLTPRELDVLRLVVQGKSDREIGEALFISRHTVMRHVSNTLAKLGVESRTAAAADAVRRGIV